MSRPGGVVRVHRYFGITTLFADSWPEMRVIRQVQDEEGFLVLQMDATPRGHMRVLTRTGVHLVNGLTVEEA